ncbi:MAG: hypothetical protein HY064_04520 [Bacteroidetes bacterium]|nr:hypothetical protein [Bacteroidota bacterium]
MRPKFIFIFLILPLFLFSQNKKPGKAPFLSSFNYITLAHALTDSTMTDDEKVRSIFLWMTKHIRYGLPIEDPNDILLNRQAVCLGYSILFDSLCSVAGVQSSIIFGYAYEPWYEARDTLYLDNHAWNAVYLDGEWKLIDVTWSRGSLRLKKSSARKFFCRLFHLPFTPRYRFRKKHNENYYLPPPEKMILDHYPATASWQLLDCPVPIDSFQYSPNSTKNYLENPVNCISWYDSIPPIIDARQYEQQIVEGYQAMHLNEKNHQDIAYGMLTCAKYHLIISADTNMWWQTRMAYYDSALDYLDTLSFYYKRAAKDGSNEGKFYMRRNKRMKIQTESETKPLMRKQHTALGALRKTKFLIVKQKRKLRIDDVHLEWESHVVKGRKLNIDRPGQLNPQQQKMHDDLEEKYAMLQEKITDEKQAMNDAGYDQFYWEGPYYDSLVKDKKRFLLIQTNDMKFVNYYRGMGKNAFDTLVYTRKNEVMLVQEQEDSLQSLLRDPGKWSLDSSYAVSKANAVKAKADLKLAMGMLKQMGKLPQGTLDEKAEFKSCKKQIRDIDDSLVRFNKERKRELEIYNHMYKKERWKRWILSRQFADELQSEKWRYAMWGNFFRKYGKSLNLIFSNDMRIAKELHTKVKGMKRALLRKIRKEEKFHNAMHRKIQKRLIKQKELLMGN